MLSIKVANEWVIRVFYVIVGTMLVTTYISSRSPDGLYESMYVKIVNKLI